jgi:hypothetical protein
MTLDRSAHAGSATFGLPSASVPSWWISRRCARSIGSTSSPVDQHRRGQRLLELPVRMCAARAALHEQVARALGKELPQRGQPVRLVDVDPQKAGLSDRVLVAAGHRTNGRSDEHLLARLDVPAGERHQAPQPAARGLSAGTEVIGAAAGRDLKPPIAAHTRGDLNEPARVFVKQPELQRAVALRGERAGEDSPVSEPHPAAQPVAQVGRALPGSSGDG